MVYLGSLRSIHLLPFSLLPDFGQRTTVQYSEVSALPWQRLFFVAQSASFEAAGRDTKAGYHYTTLADAQVAGMDTITCDWAEANAGRRFAVLVEDVNNARFLAGTSQLGLLLTVEAGIPATATERPGLEVQLLGDMLRLPLRVLG